MMNAPNPQVFVAAPITACFPSSILGAQFPPQAIWGGFCLLPAMRQTLRRSCAACARSKHSCDLRTPRCSRCIKRNVPCAYANEPLTASPDSSDSDSAALTRAYHVSSTSISTHRLGSIDPFESYPQTRLPRQQVQRLIHSCTYTLHQPRPMDA